MALVLLLSACNSSKSTEALEKQIQSLQRELENTYKPGFGDLMGSIQIRHDKLWFAGVNQNWDLADFAVHELEEVFEDIETIYPDREESKFLPMIKPGLQAVKQAIDNKDKEAFEKSYVGLTNACNSCHQVTKMDFIHIITPTTPAFSNQDFKQMITQIKASAPSSN